MSRPKIITLNNVKYRQIAEIASGGFGKVYLIQNKDTGIKYALKEQSGEYNFTENESKVMKSLDHHNIVKVIDYDTDNNKNPIKYRYIMEYTELGNMRKLIGKKYDIIEAAELFLQILEGLKYIHDKGYAHRDLKPENILLFDENTLKITDFGLAKKVDENTRTNTFKNGGTEMYMAPEVFRFEKSNTETRQKSDIYALGVVFFEILSEGQLPYEKNTANWINIHENPSRTKICDFRPDIHWKLGKIIDKMNKPNINERYSNCDQIIKEIKNSIINSDSFIPDNLLEKFYNKDFGVEQKQIQEKSENQSFEQKKNRIMVICDDFIDTLNNAFLELKEKSDSKSLEFSKEDKGFTASYHENFLDFNYELVCNSLTAEKLLLDRQQKINSYNHFQPKRYYSPFEAQRFNITKNSSPEVIKMYLEHSIIAGGFLRIGNKSQNKYEHTEYLNVSSSWGCNFLLFYDNENQKYLWYLVKSNSFSFTSCSHSQETFCIQGIEGLMRFGSRKFIPMMDIVQNQTTEFEVNEKNMAQFLEKFVN